MTRSGGTLVLVALPGAPAPLDVDARAVRELSLHGTYAYQDRDFADAADGSRPNTATRNRLQSLTVRKIEY